MSEVERYMTETMNMTKCVHYCLSSTHYEIKQISPLGAPSLIGWDAPGRRCAPDPMAFFDLVSPLLLTDCPCCLTDCTSMALQGECVYGREGGVAIGHLLRQS